MHELYSLSFTNLTLKQAEGSKYKVENNMEQLLKFI